MSDEPECQLRRRRSSGNPNLPLNLDVGYQVNEGGPSQGTPSPSYFKLVPNSNDASPSAALLEFRKKQQSFDIQIEECEEEEIIIESDDEDADENGASGVDRAVTPTPIQDFTGSVVYSEGPHQTLDFLKVSALEQGCTTDVSDADDDDGEE